MFTYDNFEGNLHVTIISVIFLLLRRFFFNVWTGRIISWRLEIRQPGAEACLG